MFEALLLILFGLAAKRRKSAVPDPVKSFTWPKKALKYKDLFTQWSASSGIPVDILLAWAYRESSFDPNCYNPSWGTMQVWSCHIATNAKWKVNPERGKAERVCALLTDGATTAKEIAEADKSKSFKDKLWPHGAIGMFQITSIVAREIGCLPFSASTALLLDPTTNIQCACAEIAHTARQMNVTKSFAEFTDGDWALIRAGYVLGPRGPRKNPEKAQEIARVFLVALNKEIRAA